MDQTDSTPLSSGQRPRRTRRRLAIAGVLVLFIAVLTLTPPYVNVNRFQRRITTTLSNSLGRPVHLDSVSLHLLPVPGFTLQNLVVSEDPAFGYEPAIRANRVEATLRASSLWRRQVEFSTVRFIEPSLNLVRNPQGRWNLESVLMQASHVDTAPTAQRKAGPAPRFPYIEATGARINVKLGNEKMPFSLLDTDFALWLPSPETWRVRLQGRPARTDTNLPGTGLLRVEGTLHRAATIAALPVDLHVSWRNSPLGEASRLLTGEDAGWRGTLFTELALTGPLQNAAVTSHTQLNDLRRADFVPAELLDVTVDCSASADVPRAVLANAQCAVPLDGTTPVTLAAPQVDLQSPKASQARTTITALPVNWALNWVRLFSQATPETPDAHGALNGELNWDIGARSWKGRVSAAIPSQPAPAQAPKAATADDGTTLSFDIDTSPAPGDAYPAPILRLVPALLRPAPGASLSLSGAADAKGYSLQLTGQGTVAQVRGLASLLPPLGEGLDTALPPSAPDRADIPHPLALSCARLWGGTQTCEPLAQPEPAKPSRPHKHR